MQIDLIKSTIGGKRSESPTMIPRLCVLFQSIQNLFGSVPVLQWCMGAAHLMAAATTYLTLPNTAWGAPETWYEPAASLFGPVDGARFGTSLACSNSTAGGESIIVVGAPNEDAGAGAVYLYRLSTNISTPIQRITSGAPGAGKSFGASIAFINDINSDGRDELVIAEPNSNGPEAKIWIYWSVAGDEPYKLCNVRTEGSGWGQTMTSLRFFRERDATDDLGTVLVGAPTVNQVKSITVSFSGSLGSDVCDVTIRGFFNSIGPASSAFGAAITEIPFAGTLVGAPAFSALAGRLYLIDQDGQQNIIQTGAEGDLLGMAVAGRGSSNLSAYSAASSGLIAVKKVVQSMTPLVDHCTLPLDIPQSDGQGLAHLGEAFSTFLGGSGVDDATFASYRNESSTGGSVALFVATSGGVCNQPKVVNNCVFDPQQEQGVAIVGGTSCLANLSGAARPIVIMGSPGWSNNKGRVDVVLEGPGLSAAKTCVSGDNGPAGIPSPTPTATSTPTPTATTTPISPPESNPNVDPPVSGEASLLIEPEQSNLPAAIVRPGTSNGIVEIELPKVQLKNKEALARFVSKRWKIGQVRALALIRKGVTLFYEIRIRREFRAKASASSHISQLIVQSAFADNSKHTSLIKVRNRKTLIRLGGSTAINVSWRVGIIISRDPRVLYTKPSPVIKYSAP